MKLPYAIRRASRAGFTLAELMVVIVILALLATFVVPNVWKYVFVANDAKAKIDLKQLDESLKAYALQNGMKYPDGLDALVTPDENGFTFLDSKSVPLDPWGNEYQYEPPSYGERVPKLWSMGADGQPGGEGEDRDIFLREDQST